MDESLARLSPVTPASATIGIPSPPNATGAVLAIRQTVTASRALKPSPRSRYAAMATGAPNPAVPSRSAPKQKATDDLNSRVARGVLGNPPAKEIELACCHREVVEPQ